MDAGFLHDAINAVCPIVGVSIGNLSDKTTWRFTPVDSVTDAQKAAARVVIDGWDGSAKTDQKRAAMQADRSPQGRRGRAAYRVLLRTAAKHNALAALLVGKGVLTVADAASVRLAITTFEDFQAAVAAEIDNEPT